MRKQLIKRLNIAFKESGLTKTDLTRLCNVSFQALNGWLHTGRISRESLIAYAEATGFELNWLATGEGVRRFADNVDKADAREALNGYAPLISWANAGDFTESIFEFTDETELYPLPPNASKSTFVLKVVGESMVDEYKPGSLIFVDPERVAVSGDDVIAILDDTGEATFKRYIDEPGVGKMLKSLNSQWPNPYIQINGNCTIAGVIIADMRIR